MSMRPYKNGKTIQARSTSGRFRQWELGRDFGVAECPWCHTLSAHRPDLSGQRHIDPSDMARRVCSRCGWDSADKHSVNADDWQRARQRARAARDELLEAWAGCINGDADAKAAFAILDYQALRELRRCYELEWLA